MTIPLPNRRPTVTKTGRLASQKTGVEPAAEASSGRPPWGDTSFRSTRVEGVNRARHGKRLAALFISARVTKTQSVNEVAMEAARSPEMISSIPASW
jgi:hypothetical protein